MKVSFAIVNSPQRQEWGLDLYRQLAANGSEAVIAFDAFGEGAEANHIRAFETMPYQSTHHCVIEDDAVLSSQFHERLTEAIESYPEHIISLYCGRLFPRHRQSEFERAAAMQVDLVTSYVAHGVANVYPADVAEDLARWVEPGGKPVDEQVSDYAQFHQVPVVYLMPSIVDHRDEGSVIPATAWQPRLKGRTAHSFVA